MRANWYLEAVKAIRQEATKAPFPGDADPIEAVLDRYTSKLFSECANEGVLGADGCPTCRAYRTERAEATSVAAVATAESVGRANDKLQGSLNLAEAEKVALGNALDAYEAEIDALKLHVDESDKSASEAQSDAQEALAERGVAQRNFDALSAAHLELLADFELASAKQARIILAVDALKEVL